MRVDFKQYPDEVSEGERAFLIGETGFDNPYPYTDDRRKAWEYGYQQMQEKAGD